LSIFNRVLLNTRTLFKRVALAQPCILCGSMSRYGLWCEACERALPYLQTPLCQSCALPIPDGNLCGHCLAHPPKFSRTTAVYAYTFPVNKLIQQFKYGDQLALADALAKQLELRIDHKTLPDCIIAMPLHSNKLQHRGYNQALLLAKKLARELDIELLAHAMAGVRDTPSQSALPFKERGKNMRNAFVCDADLSGKKVALVDDVLTSGASLNALATAVQKRGATDIQTWVVARTIKHSA
jgi:ComF family protein